MLHNGVVVVIVSSSWFFGFAAELQSKILLVARSSSPKLEQTFFTGMGKIDCRAGGDAFCCFFYLGAQQAVSKGCLLGHLARFLIVFDLSGIFDAFQICKVY